nr:exosome complex RNA-binding protein Rrp4 [Thermoproteota archaeon]
STRIGIAEAGREGIKVIPLSGVYIPRVNDVVIGKIVDRSSLSWDVDINSCFTAHLPAQDVFGRDFSPARDDMNRELATGDLLTARIIAFDRTRDPMLTIQDRDLGKIPRGESLKISATRVPRLIGKRGSMIQTIEQATQTRVLIGQNGIIVVTGRTAEGIELAVKAIRMVEEEAHTSNLTQRIKILLNVPDTPPQQTSMPSEASSTKSQLSETPKQISSSTSQTEIQSELKAIQESHTEGQEREQYKSSLPQQNPNVASAMPISNPSSSSSSSSSSSDSPLQSSPLEGASQSEKSRKVDKERSITSSSGTETRRTKSAVKGVNEGSAEHGKKEEGA